MFVPYVVNANPAAFLIIMLKTTDSMRSRKEKRKTA